MIPITLLLLTVIVAFLLDTLSCGLVILLLWNLILVPMFGYTLLTFTQCLMLGGLLSLYNVLVSFIKGFVKGFMKGN